MKKVVVIGGTGQVGSVIVEYLRKNLSKEYQVYSCSRKGGKSEFDLSFDALNDNFSKLGKVDFLVNCLGIIEETKTLKFEEVHYGNIQRIIANRETLGDPKIIQISALGAEVGSPAKYTHTKGLADKLLSEQDNWIVFRPSFVCTPGTAIIGKVELMVKMARLTFNFLPIPEHFIQAKFQPILGTDLAEGVLKAITTEKKNQIINVTGPETYTLKDWVEIKSKGKVKFLPIPKWLIDLPFKLLISIIPGIMNKDQYYLIGLDNIADNKGFENFIGTSTSSTKEYWKAELD
jgi:uncharacterized protein YbjT (DUF2867 family)